MKTPVEILLRVVSIGGELDIENGRLRMRLPPDCPPELKDEIRQHKCDLLDLMRLTFWFQSGVLKSLIFFVADDATKQLLVGAGVDPGIVYTKPELAMLIHQRVKPEELPLLHAARQIFKKSKWV